MPRIRIPLDDTVKEAHVDAMAFNLDWWLEGNVKRTEDVPHEVIWRSADRRTRIHYVQDFLLGIDYLLLEGKRPGPVADAVRSRLKTVSLQDALAAETGGGPDALRDALYFAALAAPEEKDDQVLALFRRGFAHPDPDVRSAAVLAAGYLEWPELAEPLRTLGTSDPDPQTRAEAAAMLEGLQAVWKEGKGR